MWTTHVFVFSLFVVRYEVKVMCKLRDGRGNEEGWLLVQWISEDEGFLLKTDEKNAWQLLSLSVPLCLSPISLTRPSPLPLSMPPTSGIYMPYWDWIDCTWEVYQTKHLLVQLVHLDKTTWERERRTPFPPACPTLCPLLRRAVFLPCKCDRAAHICLFTQLVVSLLFCVTLTCLMLSFSQHLLC